MTKLFLVLATVADLALATLLVAVSGFIFGGGPESMHAGSMAAAGYIAAVIACLVAPIAGFILDRRGKGAIGLAVAWIPVGGALVALMVPAPY